LSTTGEVQTLVEVANYGSSPARGNLTLSHQGTELWRESIDVAAHGRKAVTRVVTLESGIITATLDHPDAIAADNVRSAVIAPATIGVRLRGASFHVERALASHPGLRLLPERTSTAPDAGRDEADILVCGGCAEVPSGGAPVLLIPPRPPSSAGVSETSLTPIVTTGRALPLADAFEGAVVPVRVDRPVADTDVAARAGGLPVVVAHDDGVRRIVELRFDPEASPFARGTGFPVLIATALDWLSLPSRNHQTVTAGEAVQWFLPGVPSISVTGPDGHAPAFTFAGGRLLARPSTAGIYRVRAGGAELALVVNPATDESDLSSNRPEAVARAAAPSGSQPARVDATGWLAIGALLILAAEWRYRHRHSRVKQA
jgi:hypothetical protein